MSNVKRWVVRLKYWREWEFTGKLPPYYIVEEVIECRNKEDAIAKAAGRCYSTDRLEGATVEEEAPDASQ